MCDRVKDDALSKRIVSPPPGRMSRRSRFCDLALVGYLLVLWPGAVLAQDSTLEATVHEIKKTRKWIHVPLNQSVMIETNLPIARQQSLAALCRFVESSHRGALSLFRISLERCADSFQVDFRRFDADFH